MNIFIKNNVIKHKSEIVIIKDGMQIFNPSDEMLYNEGWSKYEPVINDVDLIDNIKNDVLCLISWYDSSNHVNTCIISYMGLEMLYWVNKTERSVLKTAVEDCIKVGRTIYRLDIRELGISIPVNCEILLMMLSQLEVYAIDCYNKTTDHIFTVKNLTTIEEIENYNYKEGYPEKLKFEL